MLLQAYICGNNLYKCFLNGMSLEDIFDIKIELAKVDLTFFYTDDKFECWSLYFPKNILKIIFFPHEIQRVMFESQIKMI